MISNGEIIKIPRNEYVTTFKTTGEIENFNEIIKKTGYDYLCIKNIILQDGNISFSFDELEDWEFWNNSDGKFFVDLLY